MKFPCTKCGDCCRHIDFIPQLSAFDQGNGVCKHLQGNLCDIYENRPEICRVDVIYKKYFSNLYSEEEYIAMNLQGCKKLMDSVKSRS